MTECDKMLKVKPKSQAIGEFLEWLRSEKNLILAEEHWHDDSCYDRVPLGEDDDEGEVQKICGMLDGQLVAASFSTERLLAEFFEIDLDKVEAEKRAMLEEIRR